jgi:hypothetical protein
MPEGSACPAMSGVRHVRRESGHLHGCHRAKLTCVRELGVGQYRSASCVPQTMGPKRDCAGATWERKGGVHGAGVQVDVNSPSWRAWTVAARQVTSRSIRCSKLRC